MTSSQHNHDTDRNAIHRKDAESTNATLQHAAHPLLRLQRQLGNQRIARMLAQREAEEEDQLQMQRDSALQREAEDELQMQRDPALQRDFDDGGIAPEGGPAGGPVSPDLASRIQARRGGGSALADDTRAKMETSFGSDFSDVRVHADSTSSMLNRKLGAKAFTTGSDIFFGAEASPSDSSLLGHELTHVVQQRSMSGGGAMTVGPAGDAHEREADAMGQRAASTPAVAQRQPEEEAG